MSVQNHRVNPSLTVDQDQPNEFVGVGVPADHWGRCEFAVPAQGRRFDRVGPGQHVQNAKCCKEAQRIGPVEGRKGKR